MTDHIEWLPATAGGYIAARGDAIGEHTVTAEYAAVWQNGSSVVVIEGSLSQLGTMLRDVLETLALADLAYTGELVRMKERERDGQHRPPTHLPPSPASASDEPPF